MKTLDHLGGHCNVTKINRPVLNHIREKYKITSLIDIGCGPGGMKVLCDELHIDWYGIDGDPAVLKTTDHSLLYDFTQGTPVINKKFDLAWSTEFLEHIEENTYLTFYLYFKRQNMYAVQQDYQVGLDTITSIVNHQNTG
jgi:Methyltransferase domain.